MKNIFKHTFAAAALMLCSSAMAQNLESAYFLDGYAYGHQMNPAKDYDRKGYISFPVLGQMGFGVQGNLGVKDLLLKNPDPNNKSLVTFLHPDLTYDQAMKGFKNDNKFLFNNRLDILGFGFHTKRSFQTFNLSLRTEMGFNLPGDIFRMMRRLENKDYNFNHFGAMANAWVEAGWGMSRDVISGVRVGGKFKLLVGGAYADIKMDNLSLNLENPDQWTVNANATAEVGLKGLEWGEPKKTAYSDAYLERHPEKKDNPYYDEIDFDNMDINNPGPGGLGAAWDLGAEVDFAKLELVKGLRAGIAINDLGFIKWKNVAIARNQGDEFTFDGFNNIKVKDGQGEDIEDLADELGDRFNDLICLQDGGISAKARMLGATLNISAEYDMPFYNKMSVGFLSTTRIQGVYSWNEERLALTLSPTKAFEVSANVGVGTFGTTVGWVMNIHPRGFNVFLGMDHLMGKLSKQCVPLKSSADFTMGIAIPFGKSRIDKE